MKSLKIQRRLTTHIRVENFRSADRTIWQFSKKPETTSEEISEYSKMAFIHQSTIWMSWSIEKISATVNSDSHSTKVVKSVLNIVLLYMTLKFIVNISDLSRNLLKNWNAMSVSQTLRRSNFYSIKMASAWYSVWMKKIFMKISIYINMWIIIEKIRSALHLYNYWT